MLKLESIRKSRTEEKRRTLRAAFLLDSRSGHPALLRLSRSNLHKILRQGELRPHKIRYYVEKRDPNFEIKMANVLHVYQEVEIVN